AAAVPTFRAVEHRLEFVRQVAGVDYYNDSKATSVDATLKALDAFAGGLWVILGGEGKGGGFKPLRGALRGEAQGGPLLGRGGGEDRGADRWVGSAGASGDAGRRDRTCAVACGCGRYRVARAGVRELRSVHEFRASRRDVQEVSGRAGGELKWRSNSRRIGFC